MELQKQVCSLDLAKQLKKLGVKQGSYFTWREGLWGHKLTSEYCSPDATIGARGSERPVDDYCAFTVAELGEMLPREIEVDEFGTQYFSMSRQTNPGWCCYYGNLESEGPSECADTEADARAKMLISILKNRRKP